MKSNSGEGERRKMKLTQVFMALALLLTMSGASALAQTETQLRNAGISTIEAASTTYRLSYTISELDGGKHVGTQHVSLTVNPDSRDSQVRLGSKVPIAVTSLSSTSNDTQKNMQYQYEDVGLNITAHVKEFATGVEVFSKLDQSSVGEVKDASVNNDPVIRQAMLQNTALLTVGKPVTLGSLDIPGSTRHLDIEVVLEVVR